MSPEQLRGEPIGCTSDVFSLGVVFYEMMGGLHPFRAATVVSTSDRILHETPVPAVKLNPGIPETIERLLERMLAKDPAERPASAREVLSELQAESRPAPRTSLLKRHRKALMAIAGILVILLIASVPSVRQSVRKRLTGTRAVPARVHLAVIPFEPVNATPEMIPLSRGLTEALNAKLVQVTERRTLQVVPASEVRDKKVQTLEQAHREFGVNLVLRGSLQQAGERLRVTYAIVDVSTRRQLRGDSITAAAGDPFALEDQVIASVLDSLEVELQPRERTIMRARGTREPAAYDYYLRARGYLQDYQKPESVQSAIEVFRHALEKDSKYALAYAGLGEAFWRRYQQTQDTKWVGEALTAC